MTVMRYVLLFYCSWLLAGCAHRESAPLGDRVPFAERLVHFQSLHNGVQIEELRAYFTKEARIQSPLSPRASTVEKYLSALKAEPYDLQFSNTQVVYSLPRRAATRSDVTARAPGRFDLKERVIVDWRASDGYWRISRIVFPDWSSIVGTWRRAGIKREGTIELRILPDGNYLVYLAGDYAEPEFRGRYRLEGNSIVLADTSSKDPQLLERSEGTYRFVRTASGMDLQNVQDENRWRAERFEGVWTAIP
jgi:hypothetical protein